ncbi:MAG: tRNA 2-selenouridine(34) synthase MnmH [Epulopiscium sp. Nuni2H_MBin003]|nr:MAG: tRNA 2-selenouridine(34) synthase MnmH [Epulopiscium sp. Nuni2H_MBin003]
MYDFKKIIINNIPLIDVRAPIEYNKGAFLNSVNLPIMQDDERHEIGIEYKKNGNAAAIELGHRLVSGNIRAERINSWIKFIEDNPNAVIYCFRGGQRSKISKQWIAEANRDVERIEGGYKAFRTYLMEESKNINSSILILAGYTGAGKTRVLDNINYAIDLEKIANHRGSSFGRYVSKQPTQINFENNLAYAIIKHQHENYKYMLLEDEGRHVGTNFIPRDLTQKFATGSMVVLDETLEHRLDITLNEYVCVAQEQYCAITEDGLNDWANYITESIQRLQKRLGNTMVREVVQMFDDAFSYQLKSGDIEAHKDWIECLLTNYYDPMYKYQLEKNTMPILFRGNTREVTEYLLDLKIY